MDLISILLISVALAMDSMSISITKGFTIKNITLMQSLWIGIFFGFFQGFMPILGWIAGIQIQDFVSKIAPWIAFILLVAIGLKMIYESISDDEKKSEKGQFSFKELTLLGIATSIDAFAVGVTFAFLNILIIIPVLIIGLVSFIFSEIGIIIGKKLGGMFGDKIEIVGGIVLIILGVKILLDGLGISSFFY